MALPSWPSSCFICYTNIFSPGSTIIRLPATQVVSSSPKQSSMCLWVFTSSTFPYVLYSSVRNPFLRVHWWLYWFFSWWTLWMFVLLSLLANVGARHFSTTSYTNPMVLSSRSYLRHLPICCMKAVWVFGRGPLQLQMHHSLKHQALMSMSLSLHLHLIPITSLTKWYPHIL